MYGRDEGEGGREEWAEDIGRAGGVNTQEERGGGGAGGGCRVGVGWWFGWWW